MNYKPITKAELIKFFKDLEKQEKKTRDDFPFHTNAKGEEAINQAILDYVKSLK